MQHTLPRHANKTYIELELYWRNYRHNYKHRKEPQRHENMPIKFKFHTLKGIHGKCEKLTIMMNVTGPMKLQMKWLSTLNQQLERGKKERKNHHRSNYLKLWTHCKVLRVTTTFIGGNEFPKSVFPNPVSRGTPHFGCLPFLTHQCQVLLTSWWVESGVFD